MIVHKALFRMLILNESVVVKEFEALASVIAKRRVMKKMKYKIGKNLIILKMLLGFSFPYFMSVLFIFFKDEQ